MVDFIESTFNLTIKDDVELRHFKGVFIKFANRVISSLARLRSHHGKVVVLRGERVGSILTQKPTLV